MRNNDRSAFRWPVSASVVIAASSSRVWQVISAPGNLVHAHPFCAANPVDHWGDNTSRDEVHYLNKVVYRREFREWHEGTGYDLEISHKGRVLAWVAWRISAVDDARSTLRITVYPNALQNWPVILRWLPHLLVLRPKLRAYLDSVLRGFAWYTEREEDVPRNQFGRHPWFSAT